MADLDHLAAPLPAQERFTDQDLIFLATKAGVDTGFSSIRPKGDGFLTALGVLALHEKLERMLGPLIRKDESNG